MALKAYARRLLNGIGYDVIRAPGKRAKTEHVQRGHLDLLSILVDHLVPPPAELRFVQVGAFDGLSYDPLRAILLRRRVSGVFVEPQPRAFAQLLAAYGDTPGLAFENCAISDRDGEIDFHMLRDDAPADLPVWLHQSASLDRTSIEANLRRHFRGDRTRDPAVPDVDSLIMARRVPTMTWETLFDTRGVAGLDLLVIDTMGLDCKLLLIFPFDKLKPRIIHFEHTIADREDVQACLDLLERNGYRLAKVAVDTIACLDVPVRQWPVAGW